MCESRYGDGFYLHVRGIAFNMPAFLRSWPESDEFTIGDFVAILAEIPPGGTASKLHTGTGWRKDGPFLSLP